LAGREEKEKKKDLKKKQREKRMQRPYVMTI
jgi:hypothetical protein